MQLHPTKEDGDWNGTVTKEKEPGEDPPGKGKPRRELLIVQA
jgi:hypothetical protein